MEFPTVVQHNFGKGKVLYFANQPDTITYEMGHPDTRNLLLRSIRHLAGSTIPIRSTAPESVHIGLTRSIKKPGEYILSLVNTTSGPVRPVRRLLPVHDIQVTVRLEGKSLRTHQVVRAQGDCRMKAKGNELELRLSRLDDCCLIHIQMST
jgi:hypothetical protein